MPITRFFAFLITTLLSSSAFADGFGDAGTWVPSGNVTVNHQRFAWAGAVPNELTYTSAAARPTVDYFVVDRLSVGAGFIGGMMSLDGQLSYTVGGLVGVGYALELSESLGLYPRAAIALTYSDVSGGGALVQPSSSSLSSHVSMPLLYHLDNLFIGAGPELEVLLANDIFQGSDGERGLSNTRIGLTTVLGGWF
ncbi:MAG: hypothetical protein RIT81_19645 [Deltaproteobacteria bacterium]